MKLAIVAMAGMTLAACASGGDQTLPSARIASTTASKSDRSVSATIRIHVPKRRHRARYVSPSTQGMTIVFSGPTTIYETVGLTPSSPGCSSNSSGTTCTEHFSLAPCPSTANCYSGLIATYDAVTCFGSTCAIPPNAHALSANQSVAFSVRVGASNPIALTLDGIAASVALVPQPSSTLSGNSGTGFTISKCVTAPQSVNVVGIDADGNQIVGAGAPTAPTLSSNDATHLAVATPAPSAPSTFTLVPPSSLVSATIPNAETVVQLTAGVTPLAASGGSVVSRKIDVTFDGTVCGVITEYSIPTSSSFPKRITAGPDGALWFTETVGDKIGRITTGGTITETTIPTSSSLPEGIAAGPDGALWFTESTGNKIGRINTGGLMTEYSTNLSSSSGPFGITAGPDGALWFTEAFASQVGRITTAGVITETTIPTSSSDPEAITAGPDGALWFTESSDKIGRITTGGAITEYTANLTSGSNPFRIAAGPDDALWFTEISGNRIGRITTSGSITETTIPTTHGSPEGITAGPDGALWFVEACGNKIGRITTSGTITETTISGGGTPSGITAGPDGALWFTVANGNKIGRDQ